MSFRQTIPPNFANPSNTTERLNILITTQFGGIAGSTYSIFYLARGLSKKGHNVILGMPNGVLLEKLARTEGIKTYAIPFRTKLHPRSLRIVRDIVKNENIDLINPQESKDRYNVIFSKIIAGFKAKIVLTRRQRVGDNNPIKRWIHVRYSEKIVVISHGLQQLVKRKGFPVDHTHVIYNGLPLEQFVLEKNHIESLRSKYSIGKNDIIIGAVARIKRQDQVVRAMGQLPESWKVLFVGITRQEFDKKWPGMDLPEDRFIFTGSIENKADVLHHYALMTLHILSSQMDGFGLVLAEAMAMGVPVIGSRYGGIPDVIEDGKSGFIFDNGNIDQLADQIRTLAENNDLRNQFIQNGANRVLNRFSVDRTVEEYERLFKQIINS